MKQELDKKLPPPEQAFEWAHQSEKKQNWIEAAQRWSVLRKAYPKNPLTWVQAANAHIEAGELKEAEILLNHALQHFSDNPNTLIQSAVLATRQKDWDIASSFLQQAREQFPNEVQTWLKSAELAEHQGNMPQAFAYNQKARHCAPDRPIAFIQHAEITMRAELWDEALEHWATVRKKYPENPTGYLRAAEAARNLGQLKEARKLTLAYQYGDHLLEDNTTTQSIQNKPKKHSSVKRLLELIWTKTIFNLRSEVHHNYLSYSWWILEPLLHMIVYYVVFGLLLNRGGENYPVFLLTGLIPWMWFMKAVGGSSNSIVAGQHLMLQVGIPSIVFPLVSTLQSTLKQLPVFIILFGFVWLQGYGPNIHWWSLFPVLIVQALLTLAFACLVAAIIPFIRDLSYLVPTGLAFLMFLSGIFYDYRMISADWQELFLLNPIAFLLKCYREIFIAGTSPDFVTLSFWGIGSTIICAILLFAYQRLRYVYPRVVLE